MRNYLTEKKRSFVRNYFTEQERFLNKKLFCREEKYKFHYLKSNRLMRNYLAEQEKNNVHAINQQ
jgi:hypothetical protein